MARILVVEDDRHISRVISLWLNRNGHQATAAYDGHGALEMLREERPDLLITDVNIPGPDGLAVIRTARAEGLLVHPAIVLTSRCDQVEIEAEAEKLEALVHPKPFSPQRLMEAIESALRSDCGAARGVSPRGDRVSA